MSTNQSIYQQPPPAYSKVPTINKKGNYADTANVKEKKIPTPSAPPPPPSNNVSPGFSRNRRLNLGSNYNSPIINIEYGPGGYGISTGSQVYPNPAFQGTAQAPRVPTAPNNLEQEKLQTFEKVEEMKDKADTKSADEMSNATVKKYSIIFAALILIIAGVVLLWAFYVSKTRSAKDAFTSSDAWTNSANSSGEWAQSSGKSADSSKKI
jgi:hypothetical protein